jgi:hypothetical protein
MNNDFYRTTLVWPGAGSQSQNFTILAPAPALAKIFGSLRLHNTADWTAEVGSLNAALLCLSSAYTVRLCGQQFFFHLFSCSLYIKQQINLSFYSPCLYSWTLVGSLVTRGGGVNEHFPLCFHTACRSSHIPGRHRNVAQNNIFSGYRYHMMASMEIIFFALAYRAKIIFIG